MATGVRTATIRDPWFDNARWLAGSLVVMIHLNDTLMSSSTLAGWLHGALHPARIPLFAILVGYFTARIPTARDYSNLIRTIIAPFLIMTLLHLGLNLWWGSRPLLRPLSAPYTLWFMWSVIAWRLLVPVVTRFRYPMLLAIAVSVVSGVFEGYSAFSLHRTLGLLPFVILGSCLHNSNDDWLRRRTRRKTTVALAIVTAWVAGVTLTKHWSVYNGATLGMWGDYPSGISGTASGMLFRPFLLLSVAAASLAVLHLMPRRRIRWISYIGAGGFTIYLLHGLVIRLLRRAGLLPTSGEDWWVVPSMVLLAFALAALLGSRPVRWLARPLVRPKLNWLLRPASLPPTHQQAEMGTELSPTDRISGTDSGRT